MRGKRLKTTLPIKLTLYLDLTVAQFAAHMTPHEMRQLIAQVQQRPDLMANEAVQYALALFRSYVAPEPDRASGELARRATFRRPGTRPQ
ncbi:MAG: hypothetical protein IT324_15990 [Anaerolineae bacterium]|nr:hypothetical protein [Anaerolineae bacterium]